jgi:hypothetical protein
MGIHHARLTENRKSDAALEFDEKPESGTQGYRHREESVISEKQSPNRRKFLKAGATFTTGMSGFAMTAGLSQAREEKRYVAGPIEGCSRRLGRWSRY